MNKLKPTRDVVIILVIVALLVAVVAVVAYYGVSKLLVDKKEQRYRDEINPYILMRAELRDELFAIEEEYMMGVACGANATVVFVDLYAELYDIIFKEKYEGKEYVYGTVCFSEDELPNLEGRITSNQLDEMLAAGWSTSIYWDGSTELRTYLTDLKANLSLLGYEMPNSLFFEVFTYSHEYDEVLVEFGIKYAIQHGEIGDEIIDTSTEGEIFHPGVVGWNAYEQQKNYLRAIYSTKGCGSYSVSLGGSLNSDAFLDLEDGDVLDAFGRMLDYLDENAMNEYVTCLGYDRAWENRREYVAAVNAMDAAIGDRRQQIFAQIDEIEKQMLEIRKKYE